MNKQGGIMNAELIKALREDAEWAHANEWETPITLGDHLDAAADALEAADNRVKELKAAQRWIPCEERLPEEHNSMFAKFYGTDKWNNVMWQKQSNQVNVVLEFEDGTRMASTLYTHDGKWKYTNKLIKQTVTHWRPLPAPPQKG